MSVPINQNQENNNWMTYLKFQSLNTVLIILNFSLPISVIAEQNGLMLSHEFEFMYL